MSERKKVNQPTGTLTVPQQPTIVFLVGSHIEKLQDASKLKPLGFSVEFFPELDEVTRLPMHATRMVEQFRVRVENSLTPLGDCVENAIAFVSHSGILLNCLGLWINEGVLRHEDVEVWMLDGEKPELVDEKRHVYRFTHEGVMGAPWPFGWFLPEF